MYFNIFDVSINGTCISISIFIPCIEKYNVYLDIDFESVISYLLLILVDIF